MIFDDGNWNLLEQSDWPKNSHRRIGLQSVSNGGVAKDVMSAPPSQSPGARPVSPSSAGRRVRTRTTNESATDWRNRQSTVSSLANIGPNSGNTGPNTPWCSAQQWITSKTSQGRDRTGDVQLEIGSNYMYNCST